MKVNYTYDAGSRIMVIHVNIPFILIPALRWHISMEYYRESDIVILNDSKGDTYILRNRFGHTGLVAKA